MAFAGEEVRSGGGEVGYFVEMGLGGWCRLDRAICLNIRVGYFFGLKFGTELCYVNIHGFGTL